MASPSRRAVPRRTRPALSSTTWHALFDALPVMVCALDRHRSIVRANRAFLDFAGLTQDELGSGRACGVFGCINATQDPRGCGFGPQCTACQLRKALDDTIATGRTHRDVEYRATLDSKGHRRDVVLFGSTTPVASCRPYGVLLTLVDVTAYVHAAEERQIMGALLESSTAAISVHDTDGACLYANEQAVRLHGYTRKEFLALALSDVDAPESARLIESRIRRLREDRDATFEVVHRRKDGSTFPLLVTARFTRWGQRDVILSVATDISERKRMEETLRESEARYRAVVEDQTELVSRFRVNGTLIFVNDVYCRFFGRPADALIGSRWQPAAFEADLPYVEAKLRTLSPVHPVVTIENRVYSGTGQIHWMQFVNRAFFDDRGQLSEIQSVARDITERKQAEIALRESEDRYHTLVAASLDAVLLTVPDGRILSANATACRMFGRSEEELIRIGRAAIMDGSDPRLAPALAERERTGRFTGELTFLRSDGTTFPGEISSAVFPNRDGELRTSMVIRDITDRKEAEAARRVLIHRLQTLREEEHTRIARRIHDELGQFLSKAKMDLGWLEKRLDTMGNRPEINTLLERAVGLTDLVDQAMNVMHRIASELRPGILDRLGLRMALEHEADAFRKRTGIACRMQASEGTPSPNPEAATAIFRIVQEALLNVARHASATAVDITLEITQDESRLTVSDNGIGIAREAIANPKSLGLLGMRERMDALGGTLTLHPGDRNGTVLIACIPMPRNREASHHT